MSSNINITLFQLLPTRTSLPWAMSPSLFHQLLLGAPCSTSLLTLWGIEYVRAQSSFVSVSLPRTPMISSAVLPVSLYRFQMMEMVVDIQLIIITHDYWHILMMRSSHTHSVDRLWTSGKSCRWHCGSSSRHNTGISSHLFLQYWLWARRRTQQNLWKHRMGRLGTNLPRFENISSIKLMIW